MELSKSKYCNAIQCKKMLWLDCYKSEEKEEVNNDSVLDNGTSVGLLAKDLFGEHVDIEFNYDKETMIKDTISALKEDNVVVTEASFIYNNNFCSVDILKKNNNEYEIVEVKSSTKIDDIYIEDVSYQYYILKNLGYNVVKVSIAYINNQYTRNGKLDLEKLFNIEDITEIVIDNFDIVSSNIASINKYMTQKEIPKDDIGVHCFKPYECPFFKFCTKHLPEENVFNIRGMNTTKKINLYNKGVYSYNDILEDNINEKYKQQIDFELNNKSPYINYKNIRDFMDTLYYPLYFLDFETYQQPIPLYDGIKPYMQIPFQYSLHYIEKENGNLFHKEFLADADIDPRRKLAERLVEDILPNACVLAYNMMFEKMVIRNLAELYPDLKDRLMTIHDNMKDLMIPFVNRDYYTKEMYGSYSIKYVLPALFPNDPSLNYHNLDLVHNGSEASNSYANLGTLSKEEQENVRNSLLRYCELDTYAMVKIWNKLTLIHNTNETLEYV